MTQDILKAQQRLTNLLNNVRTSAIDPFTEHPSIEHTMDSAKRGEDLEASQLFSLFTADIIKEEVVFTR